MRPIDADRLKAVLEKNFGHTGGASVLEQLIDEQPTIEPSTNCSEIPNSSDTISRQAALDALDKRFDNIPMEQTAEILMLRKDLRELPTIQTVATGTTFDLISRQAAIEKFAMTAPQMSVIRIYEAVEILESMPTIQTVATGTTFDLISRQAAIYALHMHLMYRMGTDSNKKRLDDWINNLPSAQPELSHTQKSCEYCHEDSDGYTRPIEKNCHAYIRFGMNGWELDLKAKGWHGEAQIKFCPMCGRELQGGR